MFHQDLESDLRSDTSGNFRIVIASLCLPRAEFLAREIHDAIRGLGTNEGTLIEILCSATNQEIRDINAAYEKCSSKFQCFQVYSIFTSIIIWCPIYMIVYGHLMEKDIEGDTSGSFRMMLLSLAQVNYRFILTVF